MARLDTTFDATQIEPIKGYELFPEGTYVAQIVQSEMRVTRNGTGRYLWLEIDILDGKLTGRKVYDQLNLIHPNPTTVEIAQRTLSSICHAIGEMNIEDSEALHMKPFQLTVKIIPPKDGKETRNGLRYQAYAAPAQKVAVAANVAAPVGAKPKAGSAPWHQPKT